MNIIAQIKELEKAAQVLEPQQNDRQLIRNKVIDYTEEFLNTIYDVNAFNINGDKGRGLLDFPISEEPIEINQAINLIKHSVDEPGLNPASGGHLAYIPGGGIYVSALGDYLAAIANNYAGVYYASPGAVRMENMLVQWLAKLIGYPENSAGTLASGGSIATLTAIVAARDNMGINSDNIKKSVIYSTAHAHHCVNKAIRIAGLSECIHRTIPMDVRYKMRSDILEEFIKKDKKDGLNPFLIIASAGTTDVGAIDPLSEIGDIAKEYNLWYHIDAAYGGFFILTDEGKKKLNGLEKSDSIVLDPHKGLFLPYGLGMVIVNNSEKLKKSFYFMANYMQDIVNSSDELSPAEISPELTKHFRGLRMWLPLMLNGLKPFRACIEEKLLLTKYFYEEVQKIGFEVGPEPELSVATYRYIPKNGDANTFNKRLSEEIVADGRAFISTTMIDGKYTLRFACLSFRSHLEIVDYLLAILKRKVEELETE